MCSESEPYVFEVREGKEVRWPEDKEGWTYETVCLECPDDWKRKYRAEPQGGVRVKDIVDDHVRRNKGHRVRVIYSPLV